MSEIDPAVMRHPLVQCILAHFPGAEVALIDPTAQEIEAMEYAGEMAGMYLEQLGKTDIMFMTREQFMTMIEATITGYADKLRFLRGTDAFAPSGAIQDSEIPY